MKKLDIAIKTILLITLMLLGTAPRIQAQQVAQSIPILMYHRIQLCPTNTTDCADITVQPQEFRDQMQYLADNGYVTLSMDMVEYHRNNNIPLPARSVVITFDDGYATQFREAYPVLKANKQKATFYIISSMVGITGNGVMTWANIQELQRSGVGEIESHTVTHPRLSTLTEAQIRTELRDSKATIESYTNKLITHLAYPNGAYNDLVIRVAQEEGYTNAVITCRVNCHPISNSQNYNFSREPFKIDRKTVFPKITVQDFEALLLY